MSSDNVTLRARVICALIVAPCLWALLRTNSPWWEEVILVLVAFLPFNVLLGSYLIWRDKPLIEAKKRIVELETDIWERELRGK
jgi:hypothetical protein